MSPERYYRQQLDEGRIAEDPEQLRIVGELQRIYEQLSAGDKKWYGAWWRKSVKGLYLWGNVGVGKTFLLDCLYACYPNFSLRMHFHVFLKTLHQELRALQGRPDPLRSIAKKMAHRVRVIFFDEFFVEDIGDAMLLGKLFQYLFAEKICLVATSNIAPDALYAEGLQRERFLPAIELIKKNTNVYHIVSHHDYRHTAIPVPSMTIEQMEGLFATLAGTDRIWDGNASCIQLLGRRVAVYKRTQHMIWFAFNDICGVPRSQSDYIELAKCYRTVFVRDVPVFHKHQRSIVTAFIHLVDVLYDADVRLVITAAAPIEDLYPQGRQRVAFRRTQSRLRAMQAMRP